jgi:Lrp/AsnC family transcriptional regulator, regulator for asnA, asnC and gidA
MKNKSKRSVDATDKRIIRSLLRNGRLSIKEIAEPLEISSPTVRSRLTQLISSGIYRVSGLLDSSAVKGLSIAIIGVSIDRQADLDKRTEEIANLEKVHWVASVTGKFDIMVEVILENEMEDLYEFLTKDLPKLGGISSTESFLVLKANRKWILLPNGLQTWGT